MTASIAVSVQSTRSMTCATRLAARAVIVVASLLLAAAAQAQHDCVPYEPTEAGQVINATWAAAFERDDYEFTVPADAGGGYVIARIGTTAPSRPSMRITTPFSSGGVVAQQAPTSMGPSPQTLEVAFEVDAGSTFMLQMAEAAVSSPPAFPVTYQWSWTFFSRVDCYEPNDGRPDVWPATRDAAKSIPLNQVIGAYGLAGYRSFGIAVSDVNNYDWYDFTLTEPAEIWIATLAVPTDQGMRLRLFDSRGAPGGGELGDEIAQVGETGLLGPLMLQPGTYYLDIHPEVRGESSVTLSEGETIPDHFDRPYHFIVSTIDPTFVSLNGASFSAGHGLAPDSWVSLFGGRIQSALLVDSTLPETLGGFTVVITDSAGAVHNAHIYVTANGQLNILTPPGMANGPATLKVWNDEQLVSVETIQIADVSPGIFSAASNGMGVAAAVFQLVGAGDSSTDGLTFDGNLAAIPLDLGPDGAELYISLFGTGLRNFSGEVTVTVDGVPVPFSGPVEQGEFEGLDQLNIGPLPRSLAGRGEVEIVITVDGKQANVVTVAFL